MSLTPKAELRQNHRDKDQSATDELPQGKGIAQYPPTEERAEHRFQRHDDRGYGRRRSYLSDILQGIGDAAGEDANEEQGRQSRPKIGEVQIAKLAWQEDERQGDDCGRKQLQGAEANDVDLRGVMVHDHDLNGEKGGAREGPGFADTEAETILFHRDAYEEGADDGDEHGEPHHGFGAAQAQDADEYGHEDDVIGGKESGDARSRGFDADLLGKHRG